MLGTHWNLFIAFFRVGMLGFGGGPASIPLIEKEAVTNYKWMNSEDFGDLYALANTLPGPIATKMAGYIGYRVAGFWGMMNAVLANIVPTIVLMIVLLTTLANFKNFDWVQGMIAAIVPVVGMMMAMLTWQFIRKAGIGFGWMKAILIGAIVFILLQFVGVHPGIVIAVMPVLALTLKDKRGKKDGDAS